MADQVGYQDVFDILDDTERQEALDAMRTGEFTRASPQVQTALTQLPNGEWSKLTAALEKDINTKSSLARAGAAGEQARQQAAGQEQQAINEEKSGIGSGLGMLGAGLLAGPAGWPLMGAGTGQLVGGIAQEFGHASEMPAGQAVRGYVSDTAKSAGAAFAGSPLSIALGSQVGAGGKAAGAPTSARGQVGKPTPGDKLKAPGDKGGNLTYRDRSKGGGGGVLGEFVKEEREMANAVGSPSDMKGLYNTWQESTRSAGRAIDEAQGNIENAADAQTAKMNEQANAQFALQAGADTHAQLRAEKMNEYDTVKAPRANLRAQYAYAPTEKFDEFVKGQEQIQSRTADIDASLARLDQELASGGQQADTATLAAMAQQFPQTYGPIVQKSRQRDALLQEKEKLLADAEAEKKEMAKFEEVDQSRWLSESTGRQVTAGIAIALGAVGDALMQMGGMKSPGNMALQIIEQSIDRDIAAQEKTASKNVKAPEFARNAYELAMKDFDTQFERKTYSKILAIQGAQQQIDNLSKQIDDQTKLANLAQVRAGLNERYLTLSNQLRESHTAKAITAEVERQRLGLQYRELELKGAGGPGGKPPPANVLGQLGSSAKAVQDINALTKEFADKNIPIVDRARKLVGYLPGLTSEPAQWEDKADAIIQQAIYALSGKTVNAGELERIKALRPPRGSSTEGGLVKLNALKSIFQNYAGGAAEAMQQGGYLIPDQIIKELEVAMKSGSESEEGVSR